jgi:polysaccharide export outer membrane protein
MNWGSSRAIGWLWAAGLAGIGLLMGGCETPGGAQTTGGPTPTNRAPVGIDDLCVGDRVTVILSDILTNYGPIDQRIREDGTITLPLGVEVKAAGKKAGDLAAEIQREYVPKFFVRCTVSVKPEERVIYVGGQVRLPNRYVYAGEMTVLRAIKVAGDFTDYAKKTQVKVTRANGAKTEIVNCKKALKNSKYDVPIFPGDTIDVPQRFW